MVQVQNGINSSSAHVILRHIVCLAFMMPCAPILHSDCMLHLAPMWHLVTLVTMILQLLVSSSHCLCCRFMLVTPLHSDQWNRPVLVNRGWVPSTWRSDAQFRQQWETSGTVSLEAVTRVSEDPSSFVPQNNPKTGEWFWIDIPAMATALALPMDTPLVEVGCNFCLCVIAETAFFGGYGCLNKRCIGGCPIRYTVAVS